MNRRRWLAAATACAAGLGAAALRWPRREPLPGLAPTAAGVDPTLNPVRLPGPDAFLGTVDAATPFTIVARPHDVELAPGRTTRMLVYEVEQVGRTVLNPVLRVRTGDAIHASFWNRTGETSIVHWHGLHVDANNDGNPHYAVGPGQIYEYQIRVRNRAATCWYHPHPHGGTASQVYRGLASFLLVEDDAEAAIARALDLALGTTDVPLLLQDRCFGPDHQLVHGRSVADAFLGHLGDETVVNYTRRPVLSLPARLVRLRLLNGSSARIYRLAFVDPSGALPFAVIGADGGLLAEPVSTREAFLAPGERLDVLLDLARHPAGSALTLRSLPFDPMQAPVPAGSVAPTAAPHAGHAGAGAPPFEIPFCTASGAPGTASSAANGSALDLLPIRVVAGAQSQAGRPTPLDVPSLDTEGATERIFTLDHRGLQWQIDGLEYDMRATPVVVRLGATEIWEIRNVRGMPHPMHLHGFHFRPLSRHGSPPQVRALAVDDRGLAAAELGWKDTVLVWPGEHVRFAVRFAHDYPGEQVFMFHCHNLQHEDQGMMLNVRIVAR